MKRKPVTKQIMMDRLDLIKKLFISAANAVQNANDAIHRDLPWRTDDLADGFDDASSAVKMLSELL